MIRKPMIKLHEIFGLSGVALGIYCYARVQWQRDYAKRLQYSVLNLVSSILLVFSLYHDWNLASFVSNILWGSISIYGIYRCAKYIRRGGARRR